MVVLVVVAAAAVVCVSFFKEGRCVSRPARNEKRKGKKMHIQARENLCHNMSGSVHSMSQRTALTIITAERGDCRWKIPRFWLARVEGHCQSSSS